MNIDVNETRCKCKQCGEIFGLDEAAIVDKKYYGVVIHEDRCPYCKGRWVPLDPPVWTDKFLNVNEDEKYYSYH